MVIELSEIIKHFNIEGSSCEVEPFGTGLVHHSYKITCERESRYLLQHINRYVFREPEKVMENIDLILGHLGRKIQAENSQHDLQRSVLRLVPTVTGGKYYIDNSGEYWRMYYFIERTKVFDTVEKPELAYQAAKMFGRFVNDLNDLSPVKVHITIPRFHDLNYRYQQLEDSVRNDRADRKKDVLEEVEFAYVNRTVSDHMNYLVNERGLPLRVTHNDTKISNVLMDEESLRGLCVIDLDTIMPSTVLSDAGDMIRTFTPSVNEEETDTGKIELRLEVFKAMAEGYLEETCSILTDLEKKSLVFGGAFITLMQGIRFLSDHLEGDLYYKARYPGHNLMRARNQFTLFRKIIENRQEMERIVAGFL